MIGVPTFATDKYIQILLNHNYTTVMMRTNDLSPFPERNVTNIYSPGTNIEYNIKGETNNLVSLYENVRNQKKNITL